MICHPPAPTPPGPAAVAVRRVMATIGVQHRLGSRRDELVLQILFDRVGEQLATRFDLRRDAGDIVLLDRALAQGLAPQVIQDFKDGRPAVLVDVGRLADARPRSMREQVRDQQQDLKRQLAAIVQVHRRLAAETPAAAGFDSQFDSRLDVEPAADNLLQRGQRLVLVRARAGSADPSQPPLLAGYGPGKNLALDFASGIAHIDPEAEHLLRKCRAMPQPGSGDRPGAQHRTRALDQTLWDLGVAGAPLPLLGAPSDWWHTPVARTGRTPITHLTPHPCYRALDRVLAQGPRTPSELRRQARPSVLALREFLQAALLLNLADWRGR